MPVDHHHLVPGDQQPTNPFANQNIQKHPNLFNEASTSTGFVWQKHNTISMRHNKVGAIIYHFVSQQSRVKDKQATIARREYITINRA
jgi:hypothetical protein